VTTLGFALAPPTAANGVGDMVSSALVGTLWAVFPGYAWGFVAAASLQLLGAGRIATGGDDHSPRDGIV
jgi:hypothetical protein